MDNVIQKMISVKYEKLAAALEANNMAPHWADNAAEAKNAVSELLCNGDTVSHGGSMTLAQCGIIELLKSGRYNYLDRNAPGLKPEEVDKIYRDTFFADAYITSTNAITLSGELYNVDGNSNRIAPMLFGPKMVIVVAGYNKIVNNLNDAVTRVKTIAAPANCIRLNKDTYCRNTGRCVSAVNSGAFMCDGCKSADRICRNYAVMGPQRISGRVHVIIVGEELGY